MRELLEEIQWKVFFGVFVASVVAVMLWGALSGGPIMSWTFVISTPLAMALVAGLLVLARRYYRD